MRSFTKFGLAVLAFGSASSVALADSPYISFAGDYQFDAKAKNEATFSGTKTDFTSDLKDGLAGTVAGGYQLDYTGWDLRMEGELGYRHFKDKTAGSDASVNSVPLMFNALGDIDIPGVHGLKAYAGAGVGAVIAKGSFGSASGFDGKTGLGVGYQLMAGLSYSFDSNWTLFGGYRYFATANKIKVADAANASGDLKSSVQASAIEIGLRYNF